MKGIVFLSNNEEFVSLFRNFLKFNLCGGKQLLNDTFIHKEMEQGPTVTPWASSRQLWGSGPALTASLDQRFSASATCYHLLANLKHCCLIGFGETQVFVLFKAPSGGFDVQTGLRTADRQN